METVRTAWTRVRQFFAGPVIVFFVFLTRTSNFCKFFSLSLLDLRGGDKNAKAVGRIIFLCLFLIALQIVAWVLAVVVAKAYPFYWGLTALAYSFGLRFFLIFFARFFSIVIIEKVSIQCFELDLFFFAVLMLRTGMLWMLIILPLLTILCENWYVFLHRTFFQFILRYLLFAPAGC